MIYRKVKVRDFETFVVQLSIRKRPVDSNMLVRRTIVEFDSVSHLISILMKKKLSMLVMTKVKMLVNHSPFYTNRVPLPFVALVHTKLY